jgi:hypothetical protein
VVCKQPPGLLHLLTRGPRLGAEEKQGLGGHVPARGGGHRRRGPRGGKVSGAHSGPIAPHVEDQGDRRGLLQQESEVVAEGAMLTAMLRWPTPAKNLHASTSEPWERCWCRQFGAYASD